MLYNIYPMWVTCRSGDGLLAVYRAMLPDFNGLVVFVAVETMGIKLRMIR